MQEFCIDFSETGNANRFLGKGWSYQEPPGIWTIGTESTLELPEFRLQDESVKISIDFWPAVRPPIAPTQNIKIILNGFEIGDYEFHKEGYFHIDCIAQAKYFLPNENVLAIFHPDAFSPDSIENGDKRLLALRVFKIILQGALPVESNATKFKAQIERPLVIVHGDWQAQRVTKVLSEFPPVDRHIETRFILSNIQLRPALENLDDNDKARTVAIWEQVDHRAPPKLNQIRTMLPNAGPVVRFPKLRMKSLWPIAGSDPRIRPESPHYPEGRYPDSDYIAASIATNGQPGDCDLLAQYMERFSAEISDFHKYFDDDIASWRELDNVSDMALTDFLLSWIHRAPIFHGPDAPSGIPLQFIIEHLVSGVLRYVTHTPSEIYRQLAFMLDGWQGMFVRQTPIHPTIASAFNLGWYSSDRKYRLWNNRWTFSEYTVNIIRWAPWSR